MSRTLIQETPPSSLADKGMRVVEREGWFYALPLELGEVDLTDPRRLLRHPAVLAAPTREALLTLLEDHDPELYRSESVGTFEDYSLVCFQGKFFGIPRRMGPVDLNLPDQYHHHDIVRGVSLEEVRERILAMRSARNVEFAGWMPAFRRFGNCGKHPQFGHTDTPPTGYRFIRSYSDPEEGLPRPGAATHLRDRLARLGRLLTSLASPVAAVVRNGCTHGPMRTARALAGAVRLSWRLLRQGGKPGPVARFVHSRHFESQVMLPTQPGLVFLTSVPYTYGQHPWMIEIEDATTLFYPFLRNGETHALDPRASPYFGLVKGLLEDDRCRAIVTHIRSTARSMPQLFQSERIAAKTFHVPLGVPLPERGVDHGDGPVNLLFTNSWHQDPHSFFLRGGLEVLEAFARLRPRHPQLRLTLRASLPRLGPRYGEILDMEGVRIVGHFLSPDRMNELQQQTHVFLLPAARIHIVSVLKAMSYGQAVVVSDGWAFDECVQHERNGMVIPGRLGKASWMDEKVGLLREDYRHTYRADPEIVERLVQTVSRLVEDRELRARLGTEARQVVATRHTLDQWNQGLKAVLDQVMPNR